MSSTVASPSYSAADRDLLSHYVTSFDRRVYCIRDLPPEVTAVLFAYVSRSPKSFRDNLLTLLKSGELGVATAVDADSEWRGATGQAADDDAVVAAQEKARAFHEKWVVGYGHASVAEHADLKYAVENISIHAAKVLEDNRLGSYTEKSTRYQVIGRDDFVMPAELEERPELRARYEEACRGLFDAYEALQTPVGALLEKRHPRGEKTSERAWQNSIKAKVCDVTRYLLPAATRTSLGVSFNARTAAHAISKCMGHPLAELREIGTMMLEEGEVICPALLKYTAPNEYRMASRDRVAAAVSELLGGDAAALRGADEAAYVALPISEPDAIRRICAALIYEASALSYDEANARASNLSEAEEDALLAAHFDGMGRHDWPARSCEHAVFTADMLVDYGAFRDIQRHRLASQTEQPTTCRHGYEVPPEVIEVGEEATYRAAMDRAAAVFDELCAELPAVAPLVVAQGFRKRVMFTWNLRELEHFIRLRSGRAGHISYRRVAQQLHDLIAEHHPRLARWLRCDRIEADLGRLEAEERAEAKRAALAAASSSNGANA